MELAEKKDIGTETMMMNGKNVSFFQVRQFSMLPEDPVSISQPCVQGRIYHLLVHVGFAL